MEGYTIFPSLQLIKYTSDELWWFEEFFQATQLHLMEKYVFYVGLPKPDHLQIIHNDFSKDYLMITKPQKEISPEL